MKARKAPVSAFDTLGSADYFNLFLVGLYLLVDFIPKGDAIDFNGPQWLYLGILNMLVIAYLFTANRNNRTAYNIQFNGSFFAIPAYIYGAFFIISGLSFFVAFNTNEFIVCYARCIIAFIGFVNLALVMQRTEKLLPYVAQIVAAIVFIKCIEALQGFFAEVSEKGVRQAVVDMKSDTGNKNVFSSGLVVKVPFMLYCVYIGKKWQRAINMVMLTLVLFTLFIANARSAYLGIAAELIVYLIFCVYDFFGGHKDAKTMIRKVGFFLLPLVLGILFSQVTIDTQRRTIGDGVDDSKQYGTVAERVGAISLTDSSSSGRTQIWRAGIQLFKDHPFGTGYGNWKITSIPYERLNNDDNAVSVHAHNDFIEVFGESGFAGGIVYILLFLLVPFVAARNIFSKAIPNERKILLLICVMGIGGYFVDAALNFPMERATMQIYFMIFYALFAVENYRLTLLRKESPATNAASGRLAVYLWLGGILSLSALYITYQTWQSMIIQNTTFPDVNADVQTHRAAEVNDQFPELTNVTMWGLPVSAIKARYLFTDKKYDEGVAMLENVKKENPYLFYAEFLKGKMYYETGRYDSAYKYAVIASDARPRNVAYFGLLAFAASYKNDSLRIKKAFYTITKYRHDPAVTSAWNNYLYSLTVMKYPIPYMLRIADSGYLLFPTDTVMIKNSRAMHAMAGDNKGPVPAAVGVPQSTVPGQPLLPPSPGAQQPVASNAPPSSFQDSAIFYDVFQKGNAAFMKNDLKNAIDLYEKALKINPTFYAAIENIGVSYFLLQNYSTGVRYLDMAIANKGAVDGKAEYFRGIALINMGKRDEGCQSFLLSEGKKYYDARRLYDLNCNLSATPPAANPPGNQ